MEHPVGAAGGRRDVSLARRRTRRRCVRAGLRGAHRADRRAARRPRPRAARARARRSRRRRRAGSARGRAGVRRRRPRASVTDEYVVDAYGDELVRLGAEREDLVVLDADLASDCRVRGFELAYPDRFVECGIAEQDMVSTAAGLARHGLLPVVNSFASFLAARANEQIYNQASERIEGRLRAPLRGSDPGRPGQVAPVRAGHLAARRAARNDGRSAGERRARRARFCAGRSPRPRGTSRSGSRSARRRAGSSCRASVEPGRGHVLRDGDDAAARRLRAGHAPRGARPRPSSFDGDGIGLAVVAMPWLNRVRRRLARRRARGARAALRAGGPLAGRRPRRRAAATSFAGAGASSRSASRAGPRAGRRRRRFATTGSTAARLRTRMSARLGARGGPMTLEERLGRPPRPALDPALRRHRDHQRAERPARAASLQSCPSATERAGLPGRPLCRRSTPRQLAPEGVSAGRATPPRRRSTARPLDRLLPARHSAEPSARLPSRAHGAWPRELDARLVARRARSRAGTGSSGAWPRWHFGRDALRADALSASACAATASASCCRTSSRSPSSRSSWRRVGSAFRSSRTSRAGITRSARA